MTKEEFQARARDFASFTKNEKIFNETQDAAAIRRAERVEDVKRFDKEAAKLEEKYFDSCRARDFAEMELAKYYASKIEQK